MTQLEELVGSATLYLRLLYSFPLWIVFKLDGVYILHRILCPYIGCRFLGPSWYYRLTKLDGFMETGYLWSINCQCDAKVPWNIFYISATCINMAE
jgi:hypothetical protein